jgi:hypothetical protein
LKRFSARDLQNLVTEEWFNMKTFFCALAIAALSGPFVAHADLADHASMKFLSGSWKDNDKQQDGDLFRIDLEKRSYEEEITRGVGRKGDDEIPYPTYCRYRQVGTLTEILPAPQSEIEYYAKYGKSGPQIGITYCIKEVVLLGALKYAKASETAKCPDWAARQNLALKESHDGCISYTRYFNLNGPTKLEDAWFEKHYEKKAPASSSATPYQGTETHRESSKRRAE